MSLALGQAASVTRAYGAGDLDAYRALGGAMPPAGTVPEPLIAALFSYLLGVELPGPGANYLKQELRFLAPARLGERLTARVEITKLRPDKALVDCATMCQGADGRPIAEGRALIRAKDVPGAFAAQP